MSHFRLLNRFLTNSLTAGLPGIAVTYGMFLFSVCNWVSAAEVTILSGETLVGTVEQIESDQLTLRLGEQTQAIKMDQVLSIHWKDHLRNEVTPTEAIQTMLLTDGSVLRGSAAQYDGQQISFVSKATGQVTVPVSNVRAMQNQSAEQDIQEKWEQLLTENNSSDRLVILKGGVLDYLEGVVTSYETEKVQFLYDGNEIPVALSKVFGIIHAISTSKPVQAKCSVQMITGETILATDATLTDNQLNLSTGPGDEVKIPMTMVTRLDFSMGRIAYLSDMQPEGAEYTPLLDGIWEYQRDKTYYNKALQIGNKKFSKGLWIHSKTLLTYRLAGDYSRFQAIMGIDEDVARNGHGDVTVIISADGEELLNRSVTAADEAISLDLPVSDKRFLTILVDFGNGFDIGDHLDLANARLIK